MIKVNLLRDTQVSSMKKEGTFVTGVADGTRFANTADNKEIIFKIISGAFGFAVFVLYLSYMQMQKDNALELLTIQVAKKTAEKDQLNPAIKAVEDFKKEKDRVQVQIDTIKSLSKERLRNVKALEAIQNIFPEKAWLTLLKIDDNRADLEGEAVDDRVVADLMTSLEENIYFANVRLIRTSEKQTKEGTVKSFSIECNLEGI